MSSAFFLHTVILLFNEHFSFIGALLSLGSPSGLETESSNRIQIEIKCFHLVAGVYIMQSNMVTVGGGGRPWIAKKIASLTE